MSRRNNSRQNPSLNLPLFGRPVPWQEIAIFLAGVVLASWVTYSLVTRPMIRPSSIQSESLAGGTKLAPWGRLEYQAITLERPDESFPAVAPAPQPIQWFFENYSPGQLAQLFQDNPGLTPSQKQALLDQSRWRSMPDGLLVQPPVEIVRELTLPARKAIYTVLQKSSRNFYEQNPVRIPINRLDSWLASSGMSAEHQHLFRQVSFREPDAVVFADFQLLEQITDPMEKKFLGKAISQVPALLMRLRITPDSDVDALARYWGRGDRGRVIRPFLESLARIPEGVSVSVSHFLPAFARMRLYTYPSEEAGPNARRQDCFWTAMNFFNETPDNRFFDSNVTKAALETDYVRVTENWRFGDLIMLVEDQRLALHLCVYIADEVVFTKNGAQGLQPWVLLKIPDMLAQYPSEKPVQMVGYRRKDA